MLEHERRLEVIGPFLLCDAGFDWTWPKLRDSLFRNDVGHTRQV